MKEYPTLILSRLNYRRFKIKTLIINSLVLLLSDIALYMSIKSLAGHNGSDFALYILFAFNIWMFCTPAALMRELVDLFESGRWSTIDLLPTSNTVLVWNFNLFSALKSKAFWLLNLAWIATARYLRHTEWSQLALGLILVFLGISAMALLQISCRFWAPRGKSRLVSSIVYFICWFLSGAIIPIQFLMHSSWMDYFNPMSMAVALPMGSIFCNFHRLNLSYVFAGMAWNVALFFLCRRFEENKREKFYV